MKSLAQVLAPVLLCIASCCAVSPSALCEDLDATTSEVSLLQTGKLGLVQTLTSQTGSKQAQTETRETNFAEAASKVGLGVPVAVILGSCIAIFILGKTAASVKEYAAYAAEFAGTFALVFTVGCCVATGSGVWNATAIACVLMVMVYATGPISGGHLNPAVTLALALADKFDWEQVPVYCATQIVAGIAAGSCTASLLSAPEPLAPAGDFTWSYACVVETIYTFMLCFVVLNCAASIRNNEAKDGNQFFGLAIGFVIIAGGYAGGPVSGGCFNPAVAFGVDFSSKAGLGWSFAWVGFEMVGAALAALAFRVVRPEDYGGDSSLSPYEPPLYVKLVSEFLGVFMLVLTVGLNVVLGSASTAWSAAAALMCMIYSLGDVSGAHFNPAVSLAVCLRGKCSVPDLLTYIPVQLLAGASAGAIVSMFHQLSSGKDAAHFLQPGKDHTLAQAGVAEMIFTFVLCYVVLATATTAKPESQQTKQNFYFGLAIGSCVTAGGIASGAISGGELNPAVSTGLAMASSMFSPEGATIAEGSTWGNLLRFSAYELAGGLLAALLFQVTHPKELGKSGMWISCFAAEFLGTFVLVFTVVCNVLAGDPNWSPTSIACSLMVMIYATGGVSGGHLNPAVTFAVTLVTNDWSGKFLGYWLSQVLGGVAAGFAACSLHTTVANIEAKAPYQTSHALMAELIYTFMLAFTVLSVAVSKRNNSSKDGNNFYALAIAWTIVAGGYAVGGVSGAAFNPAVAIGLDISSYSAGVGMGFLWALFELLGGGLAAAIFRLLRPEESLEGPALESYEPSILVKLLSEFLGVFMLVLTVGLNLVNDSPATAWSAAAALMCMIYCLGDISGAHLNPAVTMAVVASGRKLCCGLTGVAYAATQYLAGAAAGLVYSVFHAAGPKADSYVGLAPGKGFSLAQAGLAELAATMLLAYIVLSCATVPPAGGNTKTKNSFYFALAIGSCVTVGGFAIGAVSGGELNPAVALGISTASTMHHPDGMESESFSNFVRLGIFEVSAGLAAAAAFKASHSQIYADMAVETGK
ncbi:NIP4-1 [Symbiodinium sp. CCMP2592]|nr:NIP4-1 [Symbiodinium sp. CCMP2592]